jgi:predicted TIM-barrel fold metal-dependent hydrolase
VAQADQSIAAAYAGMFGWYRKAMSAAHLSALIRPVHPLFYMRNETPDGASAELAFTRTVMRIDPLLGLTAGTSPERDDLAEAVGVGPDEAGSWRRFLAALFELAAGRGCVGIKQLQAYSRPLEFRQVSDTEVVWHGQRTPEQQRVFQDWVVHECCALANDRGWPHQVHVGTHNLAQSNPLPLSRLAERYRRMTIVQLHCWPFLNECGWLAKHHANIAIDTCWMPILSPSFLREALRLWLPYVPATKVMMSQDATSIEMAAGSALFVRELLAEALTECARPLGLAASDLQRIAASMLHDNAAAVYRTGEVRCGMM